MKVMCIDDSPLIIVSPGILPAVPLIFGNTYTVYDKDSYMGDDYYMLDEIPGRYYIAKRFVPLSKTNQHDISHKKERQGS